MRSVALRRLSAVVFALLLAPPAAAGQLRLDHEQAQLSKEEIREFLRTAKVVKSRNLGKGVTRPQRLTLSDGRITHDAVFVSINERVPIMRFSGGRTELDFVDSHDYNIAAYALAELLGLDDMMPVTVSRRHKNRPGALTWWIDVLMDEEERRKRNVQAPDPEAWNRQVHRMKVFEQLVYDTDRNAGNVLIGHDWKLWMIDFTRAFRRQRELQFREDLVRCDRKLLERLKALTFEDVLERTRPYLTRAEVEPLMVRRDLIVAHFEELIGRRGEPAVLY